MIENFDDDRAKRIFSGENLTQKQKRSLGELANQHENLSKTQERLFILNRSTESDLLRVPFLQYHHLQGSERYSIDAYARRSKWRITFEWTAGEVENVKLVKIEDTH